jgi:hypothetical protein
VARGRASSRKVNACALTFGKLRVRNKKYLILSPSKDKPVALGRLSMEKDRTSS